jgi:2-polyprenyl-3-methyl-5-hydroxy-6-metoxy-1,4-benzoquinol methylase
MSHSAIPSPIRSVASLAAYQIAAALKSAIEIDFFTSIGEGHNTAQALAAHCRISVRGARILADYLVINAFLTKQGESYGLSEESRYYLDRRSPEYVGSTVAFLQGPFVWAQFGRLTECIRDGGVRSQANALQPDHAMWVTFARAMAKQMADPALKVVPVIKSLLNPRTPRPLKILDIAAGHGLFGIALAKDDPTCHVVAQDWPQVLEVTRENAVANGVADRFTMLPGDVREIDIGTGYDVVLLPNLIHHLDRASSVGILKRVRAALKPGGLVAVVEFAPNEDRVSPGFAVFSLFALATTPAGDAYTVSEILSMCAEAGFQQQSAWDVGMERLIVGVNPEPAMWAAVAELHVSV